MVRSSVSQPVWRAAAAALALGAVTAAAQARGEEVPARRGGLWSVALSGGPMNALHMTMETCADAHERPGAALAAQKQAGCDGVQNVTRTAGGYAFHSTCRMSGGLTTDTTGLASGDFQNGYIVHSTTHMSPAPMPAMDTVEMTMTARYLGACPAELKPGDTKMNGRVVHGG